MSDNPFKAVVLFSGGLDSSTLLFEVGQKRDVYPLAFNYGQRHSVELEYAKKLIDHYHFPFFEIVDLTSLTFILNKGSLSGSQAVPLGHYADESMKSTVVPNRNMIMLAIATAYASTIGAREVYYACHKGDHTIYPDCRTEFVKALDSAIYLGNLWENDNRSVTLVAPYSQITKSDIVKRGHTLGIDYSLTWSCYQGQEHHCGLCGTCVERKEAFRLVKVRDPTFYLDDSGAYRGMG